MTPTNPARNNGLPSKPVKARQKTIPFDWHIFLDLLRVKQWIKNLFILSPLVFSEQLLHVDLFQKNISTTFAFCLLSSAVYIFNDFFDIKADQTHPHKSNRPLPSGRVTPSLARRIAFLLLASGLCMTWAVSGPVFLMGVCYILLNYIYNVFSRNRVFLDVITIALGFQIRIWAGSLAIGISPSIWLQACTFVLTLFLGFTKRRHEISFAKTLTFRHRNVLAHYNKNLLDTIIIICSTLTVLFYGLYTFLVQISKDISHRALLYSTAFVAYGIFRYVYLIRHKDIGDDVGEIILTDRSLLICILLWMGFNFLILYGHKIFL